MRARTVASWSGQVWGALVWTFTVVWVGIVIFVAAVMVESRHEKRSGGQLPAL